MADKLQVGVVFGGRSAEHDISLMSAKHILSLLTPEKYKVVPIGITREGNCLLVEDVARALRKMEQDAKLSFQDVIAQENIFPSEKILSFLGANIDVVFPVLHGKYGEDGTLQGVCSLAKIPCVGSGVMASSLAMDKAATKRMLSAHRIPVVPARVVDRRWWKDSPEAVLKYVDEGMKHPCFVKPVASGSSIGVSKVYRRDELQAALAAAAAHDRRMLVETAVDGREISVAVLGNDNPLASVPGEIVTNREFYDYEAKYTDGGSEFCIPANLPPRTAEKLRNLALEAFHALNCAGMARVDFFFSRSGKIFVNELHTIPGFTANSMYPRLWEKTGIDGETLVDRLIQLALEGKWENVM